MAGLLDLLGGGGLDPASFGYLMSNGINPVQAGLVPQADSDVVAAAKDAASAKLAAAMRQQSPNVPPAPNASTGDTFDQRFGDAGWLMNPAPADVPLPQPRPAGAPGPAAGAPLNILPPQANNPAALPPNAAPVQGPAPPVAQPAPQAPSGPGLMDRITAALANFGPGGRQGGFLGALGGSIQGAATGQRLDPLGVQNQTVQALTARGVSPDMAQILARDPQALNQMLPLMMGIKPWQVTETTDMFGQKKPILINPLTGESKAVNISGGQPRGQGGPANGGTPTLDNFDMSTVNPNLKGWDYAKQFPQEVQSAVQAYMGGGVMPSGNPRNQGIATVAKTVAQKVAMDLGQPNLADDSLFSERRKMRTDLGSSSPNTMGGILSNGKSAFEHLATLSDAMSGLGNYNGPNVPGGALAAEAGNYLGNTVGATAATKDKLQQEGDAALKYGQESTKFYAGTGGGEGERTFALNNVTGASTTSAQKAGFLQTEKDLMTARLRQKEAQIRDTLGQQYLDQHPVMTPDVQASLDKIDANIARLRGQAPAQAAPQQGAAQPQQAIAPQDAVAQAKAAIAQGANRTQVILRLQKLGINTAGL